MDSPFGFSTILLGNRKGLQRHLEQEHRLVTKALLVAEELERPHMQKALELVEDALASTYADIDVIGDKDEDASEALSAEETSQLFTFYQSSNGERIYLDSLCYRCLLQQFESVENLPPSISSQIVSLSPHQMTQVLMMKLIVFVI